MTSTKHKPSNYLGYTLLIIAFLSYKLRSAISFTFLSPQLLTVLAVALGIVGLYFALKSEIQKFNKNDNLHENLLKKLRLNGERIILKDNNCQVRENNYYEEVTDNSMSTRTVADALYDPNRNVQQNYIQQATIIYFYEKGQKRTRLTSQTFPYNAKILKSYLDNGSVILYVDRFNNNEYVFTIEQ